MSSASPVPPAAPTTDGAAPAPRPRRGMRGNWRSLVLSMLATAGVVLVLFSVVPRPDAVTQPPVDVTPVARQIHRDTGRTASVPDLGDPWRANAVRRENTPEGVEAFYAGYHRTDDDTVFVAVQQIPADAPAAATKEWTTRAVANGTEDGTVDVAGATWTRFDAHGDPARRGLVGRVGDMTTVVSGMADYDTLATVAASLRPVRD